MSPALSLQRVAAQLPFTYTGADFYALCSDAMLKAITRQASAVDAKITAINSSRERPISTSYFFDHYATKEDISVLVTEEDFMAAQRELIPSVSAKELEHYSRVRAQFESTDTKQAEKNGASGTAYGMMARSGISGSRRLSRASAKLRNKGKGKGKANGDTDEDGDEFLGRVANGTMSTTPAFAMNGFQNGDARDDEDLY